MALALKFEEERFATLEQVNAVKEESKKACIISENAATAALKAAEHLRILAEEAAAEKAAAERELAEWAADKMKRAMEAEKERNIILKKTQIEYKKAAKEREKLAIALETAKKCCRCQSCRTCICFRSKGRFGCSDTTIS
eukprot:12075508-Ditylum_brightwellii.AAC.1